MKNIYIIRIENSIDLITNSSSELFVIKGDKQKEMILEMMNQAFDEEGLSYRASDYELQPSFTYDKDYSFDFEYEKNRMIEMFGEDKRTIVEQLFDDPDKANYYHFMFDRDDEYRLDYKIQSALTRIGFEFLGSDY